MVRFSDMLSGNDDAEGARATTAPNPVPTDAIPEPEPDAGQDEVDANPEAVLDRLTQYATSARAAEPAPEPEAVASGELTPVADDLLPHAKSETRKRRRK